MRLLIVASLLGCTLCLPTPDHVYGTPQLGNFVSTEEFGYGGNPYGNQITCDDGKVVDAFGNCVTPEVSRQVYYYSSPRLPALIRRPSNIPKPKVDYNILFVQTPEGPETPDPIVVGPPKQETLVYVLTKNDELKQDVISVPDQARGDPHVFYINYKTGDNPVIAGDLNLQDILSQAANQGKVFGQYHSESVEASYSVPTSAPTHY